MAVWKEEDLKKTRRRLWRTADMTYVRGWLVGLLAVEALAPLLFLMKGGFYDGFWKMTGIICGITAVPILLFCLWRVWKIYRQPQGYLFCRATLLSPHYSYLWKAMRFAVVVETLDGSKFPVDTAPIFHTHGFIPPVMEDYSGRTVTIGYNETTGNIVVCN